MFTLLFLFFFNYSATAQIYTYCHTLSLHYALPIWLSSHQGVLGRHRAAVAPRHHRRLLPRFHSRRRRIRHPRPARRIGDPDDRQDAVERILQQSRLAALLGRDRKSAVEGKSVSVRVDLGGRRFIKKKNNIERSKFKH